jgi:hypothetical protein
MPPKIEEIDYNNFSIYTPIPYHNSSFTKYIHAHIDLIGYLNEKQLNVKESVNRDFYGDDKSRYHINDYHYPFAYENKHHGHGHGHH